MNRVFRRHVFTASVAALLSGCASRPPVGDSSADGSFAEENAELPVSSESISQDIAPAEPQESPQAPAPPPVAIEEIAEKPVAKPWVFRYEAGKCLAKADGVFVYLGLPAESNWKTKTAKPAAQDLKFTIRPLENARRHPVATDRKMRICIDPGHGGSDGGAVSRDGKTTEKSLALDIARRVEAKLRADGFETMLTRTSNDTTLELAARADMARRWRADAFVSIHLNSEKGGKAFGIETYALTPQSMQSTAHTGKPAPESKLRFPGNANDTGNIQLAFSIQRRVVGAAKAKTADRGVKRARWIVLREARMPAALVECGFVSSAKDLAFLRSISGRELIARGIYEGICDFAFGTMAPGLPARKPPSGENSAPAAAQISAPAVAPLVPTLPLEKVGAPEPERPLDDTPSVVSSRAEALKAAGLQ